MSTHWAAHTFQHTACLSFASMSPVRHWSPSPVFRVHCLLFFFYSPRSPKLWEVKHKESFEWWKFRFSFSPSFSVNPPTDNNLRSVAFSHKTRGGLGGCAKFPVLSHTNKKQTAEEKYEKKKGEKEKKKKKKSPKKICPYPTTLLFSHFRTARIFLAFSTASTTTW